MDITAITAKTALVRSKIPGVDFVVNPYLGCRAPAAHAADIPL
jgi:hypothetical protein